MHEARRAEDHLSRRAQGARVGENGGQLRAARFNKRKKLGDAALKHRKILAAEGGVILRLFVLEVRFSVKRRACGDAFPAQIPDADLPQKRGGLIGKAGERELAGLPRAQKVARNDAVEGDALELFAGSDGLLFALGGKRGLRPARVETCGVGFAFSVPYHI